MITPFCKATPLHAAVVHGDAETVRRLLSESGTDVDATQWNDGMLVDFYLDYNGNGCAGWTPLLTAIYKGDAKIVEILLKAGAKVDATNYHGGMTPLHLAAREGNAEIVEILLKAGANPFICDTAGKTPASRARTKDIKDRLEATTDAIEELIESLHHSNVIATLVLAKLRV